MDVVYWLIMANQGNSPDSTTCLHAAATLPTYGTRCVENSKPRGPPTPAVRTKKPWRLLVSQTSLAELDTTRPTWAVVRLSVGKTSPDSACGMYGCGELVMT